jgi:hypothetical protein
MIYGAFALPWLAATAERASGYEFAGSQPARRARDSRATSADPALFGLHLIYIKLRWHRRRTLRSPGGSIDIGPFPEDIAMKRLSLVALGFTLAVACVPDLAAQTAGPPAAAQQAGDDDTTIYGYQLMTPEERQAHRIKMRSMTTAQEREAYRLEHHRAMQERAKARGVTLPEAPMPMGMGMGRGNMGPGQKQGGMPMNPPQPQPRPGKKGR